MLSSKDKVDSLSTPTHDLSSAAKDKQSSDTKQANEQKTAENNAVSENLLAKAERVAAEEGSKRTRKKEEAKVDVNPTEAKKEFETVQKKQPKIGTSIAKYKAQMAEWQQSLDDAKARYDYWSEV